MTGKLQIFSLLAFLLISKGVRASAACVEFFASSSEQKDRDGTDDLIAYLATLLEQQIIGEQELREMNSNLEKDKLLNPITEKQGSISSASLLHGNEIQEYLDSTHLDFLKLARWLKANLQKMEQIKIERQVVRVETEGLHQRIKFYPLPPGKFRMDGEGKKRVRVELTHAIEMMSTPVTQRQWLDLMGENPSEFKGDDHPVERVSWWSALVFANKLSEKSGLEPTYDFSEDVTFKGSAEKGDLDARGGELKVNAPNGNIYLAKGFRLPTHAEQVYVRRNLGKARGPYYFGSKEADLDQHAWYSGNSECRTHPVAELKPLTIGKGNFYDLLGNVWEWGHNLGGGLYFRGGKNPVGAILGDERVLVGGSWNYVANSCQSETYLFYVPESLDNDIGFRLVRTLQ